MRIKLKDIKPSPRPVRSKWDEEAMEELKKSIAEQGLIVPIKVRPLDGEYEIVYGHRRVEAMRRLGLKECEAIVEGMDLDDALIQSLIENVQREDLSPTDRGRALKALKDAKGWTAQEIGRHGIMAARSALRYLELLEEPEDIQRLVSATAAEGLGIKHVDVIRESGLEPEARIAVARKVKEEQLTADQALAVARAVKAAPDETTRKAILETPLMRTPTFTRLIREAEVEAIVKRVEAREEEEKERAWWREHPSSKEFLDLLKMYLRLIGRAWESVLKEKIPPEHCNYLAGFIEDKVIGLLQEIVTGLREKAKKWQ